MTDAELIVDTGNHIRMLGKDAGHDRCVYLLRELCERLAAANAEKVAQVRPMAVGETRTCPTCGMRYRRPW